MKLKNKIIALTAIAGLALVNAASFGAHHVKGGLGAKYVSDYNFRGALLSEEALQAQVALSADLGEIEVFGKFFTNQTTDSLEADSNELTLGVGKTFLDGVLATYAGIYDMDVEGAETDAEVFLSVQVNTALKPTLTYFRDTDAERNTFEGSVSQDFDLKFVELRLAGTLGNTELSDVLDRTYYGGSATVAKNVSENLEVYADVALTDSDLRTKETQWGLGLALKF